MRYYIKGIDKDAADELVAMTDDLVIDKEIIRTVWYDKDSTDIDIMHIYPDKMCEFNITLDHDDLYINIRTGRYDVTWSCPRYKFVTLELR